MKRTKPTTYPVLALLFLLTALNLSACSRKNASHMPSIIELPGAVLGGAIENSRYQAKRKKIRIFIEKHYEELRQDAGNGGGATLDQALQVVGIKAGKIEAAKRVLTEKNGIAFRNSIVVADRLTKIVAATYPPKQAEKKLNGFTYPEVEQLILNFSQNHFEQLREAINNGQGKALDELASSLKIYSHEELMQFKRNAQALYDDIYVEPVVITFMVLG